MDREKTRKFCHSIISNLACSQGFYGRLMTGNYGDYDEILDWLADEVKPRTALDIVLALEGC